MLERKNMSRSTTADQIKQAFLGAVGKLRLSVATMENSAFLLTRLLSREAWVSTHFQGTPSPSMGEGGDGGEKVACYIGFHTYPPSRPSPARGEGVADWRYVDTYEARGGLPFPVNIVRRFFRLS